MQIETRFIDIVKRVPLTISRGTIAGSRNLLVTVSHDGIVGVGEMAPFNIGDGEETAEQAATDIVKWSDSLHDVAPFETQRIESIIDSLGGLRSARAALDFACVDWLGKACRMPAWQLFGTDPTSMAATSVTVGIMSPVDAAARTRDWCERFMPHALKIKLGSPDGCDHDCRMFEAIKQAAPSQVALRVDANGGWLPDDAVNMIRWLADRGVEYVEQPLAKGMESELLDVFRRSPIPIFADESCRTSADIPKLSDRVSGVNLKLMKAGGIHEGLRLIHTARAHGLEVMMGCMGESSCAIAASVVLGPLADHLDLDSHLNLAPDPFVGLRWENGRVLPSDGVGLGVEQRGLTNA